MRRGRPISRNGRVSLLRACGFRVLMLVNAGADCNAAARAMAGTTNGPTTPIRAPIDRIAAEYTP